MRKSILYVFRCTVCNFKLLKQFKIWCLYSILNCLSNLVIYNMQKKKEKHSVVAIELEAYFPLEKCFK